MEKVLAYDRSIVAQETGFWCGPAATQIVLDGRGIRRSEADLAKRMGTHTGGTDHIGLPAKVLAAELPGVKWTTVQMPNDPPTAAQKDRLWADLVRFKSSNSPKCCGTHAGISTPSLRQRLGVLR